MTTLVPQHGSNLKELENAEDMTDCNANETCEESNASEGDDADSDCTPEQSKKQVQKSPLKKEKLVLKCPFEGCEKVFHKHRNFEDHKRSHTGEVKMSELNQTILRLNTFIG